MPKLTVERLGHLLYEEFERDEWGVVDPFYFQAPPKKADAEPEDMGGLYEVLERVCNRLNEEA